MKKGSDLPKTEQLNEFREKEYDIRNLSKEKQEQLNNFREEYKIYNAGYFIALQEETDISHQINELSTRLKKARDSKKKHSLSARICDEKMRLLITGKTASYE